MSRSRLMFLVIVGAALVLVIAGMVIDRMNEPKSSDSEQGTAETGPGADPVKITLAVSPLAWDWIESAAQSYNDRRQQVNGHLASVELDEQDSLPIWNTPGQWSVIDHPDAWIPEASFSVEYANEIGLPFSILHPSLASTVMVWGVPEDRAKVLDAIGVLSWRTVQQASEASSWTAIGGQADWGYFKPAIAQPDRYASGLAALAVAAAEFHAQPALDSTALNDPALYDWLRPVISSVPDLAQLGDHPAEAIVTRGTSVGDVALLPENEWLTNYNSLVSKVGPVRFVYPAYQFWFDFPFAIWEDTNVSEPEWAVIQDFLNYLLSDNQQRRAATSGLRQPDGIPAVVTVFEKAAGAGITLIKPGGEAIQLPARNETTPFVNKNWTAF